MFRGFYVVFKRRQDRAADVAGLRNKGRKEERKTIEKDENEDNEENEENEAKTQENEERKNGSEASSSDIGWTAVATA